MRSRLRCITMTLAFHPTTDSRHLLHRQWPWIDCACLGVRGSKLGPDGGRRKLEENLSRPVSRDA